MMAAGKKPRSASLAEAHSFTTSVVFLVVIAALASNIIFANRSTGSWVRAELASSERDIFVANVFQLGTWTTARDFWQSGAHGTAVITAMFTGVLPYLQLAVYVVMWFAPLPRDLRGWSLCSLVWLVRWQRMLTMAALLLCVALKMDLEIGPLVLELRTVFGWGTFAFEIGVFASYALATALCFTHEKEHGTMALVGGLPSGLRGRGNKSILRAVLPEGRLLPVAYVAVASTAALTVVAVRSAAIRFTVRELAAAFVKDKRRLLSVYDVASALSGATRRRISIDVWTVWLVVLCLVAPLVSSLALAALWLVPMSKKKQRRLYALCVHLHCCASADTMFVVLTEFTADVGIISAWIINDNAEGLWDRVKEQYGGCGLVTGRALPGLGWLGLYAVVNLAFFALTGALMHRSELHSRIARFLPSLKEEQEEERSTYSPLLDIIDEAGQEEEGRSMLLDQTAPREEEAEEEGTLVPDDFEDGDDFDDALAEEETAITNPAGDALS